MARNTPLSHEVTIRHATEADASALRRLAALSCDEPLAGDVLLADVAGEPWAACSLATGKMISNAFRPTRELRDLLELRRQQLLLRPPRRRLWLRRDFAFA
jgi:hypothetical protein